MEFPDDLRYTKDHEWIRDDGNVYTVGITAYAAEQLGDITYVELPEVGTHVKQGAHAATVESVKAASDVYSPVAGHIAEINEELEARPELVNESPYDNGWFFRLDDVESVQ
ncbi:MAG TPA: glycine cleavage system protein GcvH, partial [Candidatus Hydrogenedentes bacterium]|nr:glycine cleavage system protein GcvH [Candidatus Hydrogenedentota bacterium]